MKLLQQNATNVPRAIKQKNIVQTAVHATVPPRPDWASRVPGARWCWKEAAERLTRDVESIAAAAGAATAAVLVWCVDVDSSELSLRDRGCFFLFFSCGAARARVRLPPRSKADITLSGAQGERAPDIPSPTLSQ